MSRCRVCLGNVDLLNIFTSEVNLAKNIQLFGAIQIQENDGLPQYICTICKASLDICVRFKTQCEATNALLLKEKAASITLPEPKQPNTNCSKCKLKFHTEKSLKIHVTKKHSKTPNTSHQCHVCGCVFKFPAELKTHLTSHTGHHCPECRKPYSTKRALTKHMAKHKTVKKYECFHCPKKFIHISNLKLHLNVHLREKRFSCNICQKRFAANRTLQFHYKIHTNDRRFPCPECDKAFIHKYDLQRHVKLHERKRLIMQNGQSCDTTEKIKNILQCEICGKICCGSGDLKKHMRVHTNERPFACNICGKMFKSTSTLKCHERIHTQIGRTKFPLRSQFDVIGKNVSTIVERVKPKVYGPISDKYPSIFSRGQLAELPSWVVFDKHILRFDAFFQDTILEVPHSPFQIRRVKIYFFLEDGTIQVVEPKVGNSGVAQGTLISRQRIRFPPPMDNNFYDIIDFNVGCEIEFYGRVFKITNCDQFTRNFLNRCGITVPDPIVTPSDSSMDTRARTVEGKKPRTFDSMRKFLENDKKILRFSAFWDDKNTEFGYLHRLNVQYYLADDTIDIYEVPAEVGGEPGFLFLKRNKLPKYFKELPQPGDSDGYNVLNVLGNDLNSHRYLIDPLNCGKQPTTFYTEKDLKIGAILNCYGRDIVLINCDAFTKEFYNQKYGIEDFTPIPLPLSSHDLSKSFQRSVKDLPPWNGFGTHEDSAQNCLTVEPKARHKDFKKFLKFDRNGLDSHILRFQAKMISKFLENCNRTFVISYYLSDDTIAVFELAERNSGYKTSQFFARRQVELPGQEVFSSKAPLCYTPQHMFIGASLIINNFHFVLIGADQYALRFMELNCNQFPKANISIIMDKVRNKLRPIYKEFVAENIENETSIMTYGKLREKLCNIMKDDFTEHEMVTISRAFSGSCEKPKYNRDAIRALVLTELKRYLWDDLIRLKENFLLRDAERTGRLSQKECYSILRGCRLPFDKKLFTRLFEVIQKDDHGNICYEDIIWFLDRKNCPLPDVPPVNIKHELFWGSEKKPEPGVWINWCEFNKYLNLEDTFKMEISNNSANTLK